MAAKAFPRYRGPRFHLTMLHERAERLAQLPDRARSLRAREPAVEFTLLGVRETPAHGARAVEREEPGRPRDEDDFGFGVA